MLKTLFTVFSLGLFLSLTVSISATAQTRLKKITYSDGSIRQFYYDANGKLTKEELTRNQETLSQIEHNFGTAGKLAGYLMQYQHPETPWNHGYSEKYNYSREGRLNSKERYILRKGALGNTPDKALFFSDSLTYNAAGQITNRQRYTYAVRGETAGNSPVTLTTFQYRYDEKGNLAEETITTIPLQRSTAANTQTRRVVYEYDTKANPYRLGECPIFDQLSWSKNNCIRASTYLAGAATNEKPSVSEYRYVYDNNLPVRRVQNATVLEQYEYETY